MVFGARCSGMKISIVTPSYNQVQFIERTVTSVLSQTGDFVLEYIMVDGGSTDGSLDVIKRYAAQDQRINWLSEPDHGQSDAINKGLHLATGEVVAYLNSDDIYYPGALQRVVETFQNTSVKWAYGQCRVINEQDEETNRFITLYKNILLHHYHYRLLLIVNYISQPATFWRRQLLAEIGYVNETEHLTMDYDLWCRFGQRYPAMPIKQYLAGFRLYTTSKSGQRYVQQFQQEYAVAKRYTHSWFILWLHKIHSTIVILMYKIIR